MTHQKCELKERLEIHARKANRLIERARTYTPEPDARKGALGDVELAGLNLERSRRKLRSMQSRIIVVASARGEQRVQCDWKLV
jgi:hypothetical protein